MLTRQEDTGVSPPMKMPLSFGGVLLEEWVGGWDSNGTEV